MAKQFTDEDNQLLAEPGVEVETKKIVSRTPREWFLVPPFVIKEAAEKIRDGSITGYFYDPDAAPLRQRE